MAGASGMILEAAIIATALMFGAVGLLVAIVAIIIFIGHIGEKYGTVGLFAICGVLVWLTMFFAILLRSR